MSWEDAWKIQPVGDLHYFEGNVSVALKNAKSFFQKGYEAGEKRNRCLISEHCMAEKIGQLEKQLAEANASLDLYKTTNKHWAERAQNCEANKDVVPKYYSDGLEKELTSWKNVAENREKIADRLQEENAEIRKERDEWKEKCARIDNTLGLSIRNNCRHLDTIDELKERVASPTQQPELPVVEITRDYVETEEQTEPYIWICKVYDITKKLLKHGAIKLVLKESS